MGRRCGTRLFLFSFFIVFFFYITFCNTLHILTLHPSGTYWGMVHKLTYSLPRPRSWLKHKVDEGLDSEEILSLGEAEDP